METNFDYLLKKEEYADFAKQAVEAEKSLSISPATCAILSRRALELAVRFVFSYDAELSLRTEIMYRVLFMSQRLEG